MKISAVILTKNEEKNIVECLETLTWCDEVIVIDDHSTDQTADLAKKFGATIFYRSLENDFSAQRNFGLEKAKNDWVLFIDADERISEALAAEIQLRSSRYESGIHGFYIKRVDSLWGKTLYHGEVGNIRLLRLAKKNAGKWKGSVHETWHITTSTAVLSNPLQHFPHPTLTEFLKEINFYTTLRAQELYKQKVTVPSWHIVAYPKVKFLQNYVLRQGYKDGMPGLVLALCMSLHSFLVRGKLWQLWQKK